MLHMNPLAPDDSTSQKQKSSMKCETKLMKIALTIHAITYHSFYTNTSYFISKCYKKTFRKKLLIEIETSKLLGKHPLI